MDEDEELPPMEDDDSLQMPERDISLSRPTVPTPTAVEARPKRISASEPVTFTESEMKKQDYYFVERILRHTYKRGWRFYTKWSGYSISDCTWEPVTAFIIDDGSVNEVLLSTANLRICVTLYSQPKIRPASVLGGETTPSCFIAPVKTVHLWS